MGSVSRLNMRSSMASRRPSLVSTVFSLGPDAQSSLADMHEFVSVKQSFFQRYLPLIKLVVLTSMPLLALMGLSFLTLHDAQQGIGFSTDLQDDLTIINHVKAVVASLQRERGCTCLYLSASTSGRIKVMKTLRRFRAQTDELTAVIAEWLFTRTSYRCDNDLQQDLNNYRVGVGTNVTLCAKNLKYYTELIQCLLEQISNLSRKSGEGSFWAKLFSLNLLLQSQDLTGIKRAMGGTFFGGGGFDDSTLNEFTEISRLSDILFDIVKYNVPSLEVKYENLTDESEQLMASLSILENEIRTNDSERNATKGLIWFEFMTQYMAIVAKLESNLSRTITGHLSTQLESHTTNFWVVLVCVVLTIFVCSVLTLLHGYHSHKLMESVKKFTKKMGEKNREVKLEKAKTERLLCEMLPKSIAKKLLNAIAIEPENYDEVTVYFSDIKGFTNMCSTSTPFEVIALLNDLYGQCDNILDRYDVYKVETIGDAYMVASGLPDRNGKKHSSEVCTMALEVLMMLEGYYVPHIPDIKLQMRLGIHTGPCAAGVVGQKMPRYCLFGDTINMASRMEANGIPNFVQLSSSTNGHLKVHHTEFRTKRRGFISVKGKGTLETFWLISKFQFPFRVKVDEEDMNKIEEVSSVGKADC